MALIGAPTVTRFLTQENLRFNSRDDYRRFDTRRFFCRDFNCCGCKPCSAGDNTREIKYIE